MPDDSVIIAGTDFWTHSDEQEYWIDEVNLERLLDVDHFVGPKTEKTTLGKPYIKSTDMPAFRFPEILICPKCGKIGHYRKFAFGTKKPKCPTCHKHLIPSRFVVACEDGHLDDFPYSWWVHRGDSEGCGNPNNLMIYYDRKSGGLESIKIKCNSCNKIRSMEGCFSKDALIGYQCSGRKPWLGPNGNAKPAVQCEKMPRVLQRGASNLYFGVSISALSIPPWSNKVQNIIGNYWSLLKDNPEGMADLVINSAKLEEKCRCSREEIKRQIMIRHRSLKDMSIKSYEDIHEDEYRVLCDGEYDDLEFKTEETEVPTSLDKIIKKIVLVKRLKEVVVLKGFTRISPPPDDFHDYRIVKLGSKMEKWLPAVELKGEGIFIQFDNDILDEWASKNEDRYKHMKYNLKKSGIVRNNFSPQYVVLHTFAHMFIRQLIMECGYSGAALKERIYCTYNQKQDPLKMAGILIYTASPDSDGSLGGLVREGESSNFARIFENMLEEASWCSSDPLCIESTGQGFFSLNYAACYSCALLPETCCEARNCLLDRAALIGTFDEPGTGFLSEFMP